MRILILTDDLKYDFDLKNQFEEIKNVISKNKKQIIKHVVVSLNLNKLKKEILKFKPDKVINLVETIEGKMEYISLVPKILEELKVFFTGSGSFSLENSTNKLLYKKLCNLNNIPVPITNNLSKSIVKSVFEHGSLGLESGNVLKGERIIYLKIKELEEKYNTKFFSEEFIEGKEVNVTFFHNKNEWKILSPVELEVNNDILTFENKWNDDIQYNRKNLDDKNIEFKILFYTKKIIELFNIKDYGRIDFRINNDKIYIIDINTNPCISINSGFVNTLKENSISYEDFINLIIFDQEIYIQTNIKDIKTIQHNNLQINYVNELKKEDIIKIEELFLSIKNFDKNDLIIINEILYDIIEKNDYKIKIAKIYDKIIGVCIYDRNPMSDNVYEIYWIFVDDNYSSSGIGKKLYFEVEKEIIKNCGKSILIETELHVNYKKAINFYQKLGYTNILENKDFYKENQNRLIYFKELK